MKSDGKGQPVPLKQHDDDHVVTSTSSDDDVPVVHATAVPIMKGEVQPPEFRDWQFSILFFIQVAAIAFTAIFYGSAAVESLDAASDESEAAANDEYNNNNNNYNNENDDMAALDSGDVTWALADVLFFIVGSFLLAALVVMAVFRIIVRYPLQVIHVSFFMAPVTFGFVALVILASSNSESGESTDDVVGVFWGMAAFFSAISLCYYFCYKRFMPFAAVNLQAAISAVRANTGLFFLSGGSIIANWMWHSIWILAFAGVFYHDSQKEQVPCSDYYDDDQISHSGMCDQQPNTVAIVLLALCYYWTKEVIQNTVHTTTAGAVGSWWVQASEDEYNVRNSGGCCGQDVSDSLHRACTYSFGSICMGSLLVAILQTLESMARNQRNRNNIVGLVLQCIIMCLRAYLEYFNSWAFCYVGIYGYSYLDAGKKVIGLFKARGWTTFITDRLIFRVLLMANLGIAALNGALCILLAYFIGFSKVDGGDWAGIFAAVFWFGFIVGLVVSVPALFVLESAVRTIIVCFAEQPVVVEGGNPMLQNLKETYVATYPDIFRFDQTQDVELEEREQRNVV